MNERSKLNYAGEVGGSTNEKLKLELSDKGDLGTFGLYVRTEGLGDWTTDFLFFQIGF